MATWNDMASEGTRASKLLMDAGMLRACASRAYFSAYAALSGHLVSRGYAGPNGRANPAHEQIASLTRHNLDPRRFSEQTRRELARRVKDLQRRRVSADYDPRGVLSVEVSRQCVRDAGRINAALEN